MMIWLVAAESISSVRSVTNRVIVVLLPPQEKKRKIEKSSRSCITWMLACCHAAPAFYRLNSKYALRPKG
jgi:hypothetical protein